MIRLYPRILTNRTVLMASQLGRLISTASFKNNSLIPYSKDSNAFLLEHPRGAYTTMRTLKSDKHTALFQYEHHIKRLIESSRTMRNEEANRSIGDESSNGLYDFELLKNYQNFFDVVKKLTENNIKQFEEIDKDDQNLDLKITILLTWLDYGGRSFDLYTHITHLPPRPSNPVLVDIRRGSRVEMKAKDSVWVEQRKSVTDKKTKDSNEVLLCEDNGNVREGSSSNFFVLKDDEILYTANEGILTGTVQILLLENVVGQLSQKVAYEIPNISDLSRWKEAFITSTSRLVLPIHSFVISNDCIQFVDKNAQLQDLGNGEFMFKILKDEKVSPVSDNLNKTLMDHMMDMSEVVNE